MGLPGGRAFDLPRGRGLDLPGGRNLNLPGGRGFDSPAGRSLDLPAGRGLDLPGGRSLELPVPGMCDRYKCKLCPCLRFGYLHHIQYMVLCLYRQSSNKNCM